MRANWTQLILAVLVTGCVEAESGAPELSHQRRCPPLELGEARPAIAETRASGPMTSRITRNSARFSELVRCASTRIAFKDEEGTGADRLMTPALRARLRRLERLVAREWTGVHLRVTEAWDEQDEHSDESLHYEGRAADLTTSDRDPDKLGRLGALAVEARFSWVCREADHVHVSVR